MRKIRKLTKHCKLVTLTSFAPLRYSLNYREVEIQFLILFIQTVSQFLIGFITQPSLYNQLVLIIFGRCFDYTSVTETSIGSLSNDVFERRTSVGRGLFVLFGLDFERKFLRKLSLEAFSDSNLVALRHITRDKGSLRDDFIGQIVARERCEGNWVSICSPKQCYCAI